MNTRTNARFAGRRRVERGALLAIVASFIAITTYPFDWAINHAVLESGVANFESTGILSASVPLRWIDEVIHANTLGIDLQVAPFPAQQTGPARILTLSKDHYLRNLTIAHDGYDVHIRLRRDAATLNGVDPFIISDVFREPGIRTIRTSIEPGRIRAWIDSQLRLDAPLPERPMSFWDADYSLALGNELTWQRPWTGVIFSADLQLPSGKIDLLSGREVVRPTIWDRARERTAVSQFDNVDAFLNLLLLLPLGFFSAIWLKHPRSALVALLWAPAPLTAEFLQIFLPLRFPSLSDFLANVLGVFLGAFIANTLFARDPPRPLPRIS